MKRLHGYEVLCWLTGAGFLCGILGCTAVGGARPGRLGPAQASESGRLLTKVMEGYPLPQPAFSLFEPGLAEPLDYTRYGTFQNAGTPDYTFVITRPDELKRDVGAGIYPNTDGVLRDPDYRAMNKQGILRQPHWPALQLPDTQQAFYIWTQAGEDPGVKAFFIAVLLERAGLILPAIKAYYAAAVHFPRSFCWAADRSFVWHTAPAAIAAMERLCRDYPDLNLELTGAFARVESGGDQNPAHDIVSINPGRLTRRTLTERRAALPDLERLPFEDRGTGQVHLRRFSNGHWQLLVDGRPFWIKGLSYMPTRVGSGPTSDLQFADRWMFSDLDQNGLVDAAYDAWVDQNRNGRKDVNEPAQGDFALLRDMGVNAIRWYVPTGPEGLYDPALVNKPLLRDLFTRYGIRVIVGDFAGAYTIGSGARWEEGTDYTDPVQRQRLKDLIRAKVMNLKDEPFVLMWLLGNENNLPADYSGVNATRTNAAAHPQAYAEFLNEVAAMIHEIDANHPVALGNHEITLIDSYARYAPEIDVLGINAYHGAGGFDTLWQEAKRFDRPVLITEYGCDAYYEGRGEDEEGQRAYHEGAVRDIVLHQAGGLLTGQAIGGVIYEYLDEWWKAPGNDEAEQTILPQLAMPFPDGQDHEEWLGIVSQGSGRHSPFERRLRQAYDFYRMFWNP